MIFRMRNVYTVVAFAAMVWSAHAEQPELHRSLNTEIACVFLKGDIMYAEDDAYAAFRPKHVYACELIQPTLNAQGRMSRIVKLSNIENLPDTLESGHTKLTFENAVISDNTIKITPDVVVRAEEMSEQDNFFRARSGAAGSRRLQADEERKVLVVRVKTNATVTATVEDETTPTAAELSDAVFGTDGDPLNLQSQMAACSYNKQTFIPFNDQSYQNLTAAVGVFLADIATSSAPDDTELINLIEDELQVFSDTQYNNSYGMSFPFDHVMLCLPKGALGVSLGYAFQNDWMSVINDENCLYPSVQIHEVSHNLGLEHAGHQHNLTAYDEYGDVSGYMGSSNLWEDWPRMCFNGANSWQLGYYDDKHDTFEPLETPSWSGDLVGVAEYNLTAGADDYVIILKIEGDIGGGSNGPPPSPSPSSAPSSCLELNDVCTNSPCCSGCTCVPFGNDVSYCAHEDPGSCPYTRRRRLSGVNETIDYYVAFNRKVGINNETKEGGDQVLITSRGVGPNLPTELLAILSAGDSFQLGDFGGTGNTVLITVIAIDLAIPGPARASIEITSDLAFPTASPSPSLSPSVLPTGLPSLVPTELVCAEDAECNPGGVVLACSPSRQYCDGNRCQPYSGVCDCEGTDGDCDDGEDENTCPSDCVESTSLNTTLESDTGQAGNMWDVEALNEIQVLGFGFHTKREGCCLRVFVYTKVDTYVGHESDETAWTLVQDWTDIRGEGSGTFSPLLLDTPVVIPAGQIQAFYLTVNGPDIRYTRGTSVGNVSSEDSNLRIFEGAGLAYPFGNPWFPRIWNGEITYVVVPATSTTQAAEPPSAEPSVEPSLSLGPSAGPSGSPSGEPSSGPSLSLAPSTQPSNDPTLSLTPSEKPSNEPSLMPSSPPSDLPSESPSLLPSARPTVGDVCAGKDKNTCKKLKGDGCKWDKNSGNQCVNQNNRRRRLRGL